MGWLGDGWGRPVRRLGGRCMSGWYANQDGLAALRRRQELGIWPGIGSQNPTQHLVGPRRRIHVERSDDGPTEVLGAWTGS